MHHLRLNITPSPAKKRRPPPQTDSPGSASKRPKHHIEKQTVNQANVSSTALDYIHITDVDLNGAYIKLRNTSDQVCYLCISVFSYIHITRMNTCVCVNTVLAYNMYVLYLLYTDTEPQLLQAGSHCVGFRS